VQLSPGDGSADVAQPPAERLSSPNLAELAHASSMGSTEQPVQETAKKQNLFASSRVFRRYRSGQVARSPGDFYLAFAVGHARQSTEVRMAYFPTD
jgi:hypothetical protein